MLRSLFVLGVLACALALVGGASGTKPASSSTAGLGSVFLPNPVADLQIQTLTDQKDSDAAVPARAYHDVTLTNLNGTGFLQGDWANVTSETGNPAYSPSNTFRYTRSQDEFEQVMAYYWITEAQNYIQRLGFGITRRPINMESQDVRINQWGADNSFSWDKHDLLRFGKGGVDDAEDAEVILHEYGHAMMDSQQTPFGYGASIESGSIGEGFADYWAATVSSVVAPTPDPACIADWDSVSYTSTVPHCLRRVDTNLHYPENLNGRVHHDGMIWSRALWDIRAALGSTVADTIILQGMFDQRDPTMPQLAQNPVAAASSLYGAKAASATLKAFQARGIL